MNGFQRFRTGRVHTAILLTGALLTVSALTGCNQSRWTREQAMRIEVDETNTAAVIGEVPVIMPGYHVWDSWPVRNEDGSVALINGWEIWMALTAPDDVLPGKRHDIAAYRYVYSRPGGEFLERDWIQGGPVFEPSIPFGSRQWAGCAMYQADTNTINVFYTATGERNESELGNRQRLAHAAAEVVAGDDGVAFENWGEHTIILTADGGWYQTLEQSQDQGIIYAFRDPWFYVEPEDGLFYLLFEGNTPTTGMQPAEVACGDYTSGSGCSDSGGEPNAIVFNGNVGIAVSPTGNLKEWELLPPLLTAVRVNQQLERPHFVFNGKDRYLFFLSHKFTFAPGLDGPDGLYGFYLENAMSAYGDYVPLNGSGLVMANPPEQPFQAYSWIVLPDFTAHGYVNYFDLEGLSLQEVGEQSPEYQFSHFGGTWAPPRQLAVDGPNTTVLN